MSHTLTTYGSFCNLYTTTVTDNALKTNLLVLTTMTFPVLAWSKDSLTEKTIFFWLQSSIIDCLWLCNLAMRPFSYLFRRCKSNFDGIKIYRLLLIILVIHR